MKGYSIVEIAEILDAKLQNQYTETSIEYLLIDSRKIIFPASSLFFAITTSHRDGHHFIAEAYERGVRNFVVQMNVEQLPGANYFKVADTVKALQQLAAYHRLRFHYPVIGITGSNGKTIVKEWLNQLLSPDKKIIRSPRSYNSQVGVPLSVWQMDASYELGIFEAGISESGEMSALEQIIKPTLGLFTNIGEAHQEGFKNIQEKIREKLKLFVHCETVFCSADDEVYKCIPKKGPFKIFTWGKSDHAVVKIKTVDYTQNSTTITVEYNLAVFSIIIPFADEASINNAMACLALLLYFKIPISTIRERMQHLRAVDMRLQLAPAINGCSVINDSYSFDINSFQIALDFLLQQQQHTRKTIILSDLPSGADDKSYRLVIQMLVAKQISRAILIGEKWFQFEQLLHELIKEVELFKNTDSFIQDFKGSRFRNEAILLKGARVFSFEKIAALFEKKVHQTMLEINLTALASNLKQYQQQLKPGIRLMAMVKAFGYGSGSAELAGLLQFHKVDYLAVAYADEGVDLRQGGIHLPILVLNVDEAAFEALIQYNLEPELFSFEILHSFILFLEKQGLQHYPVHIKFDTGMHRLGFEKKDLPALVALLEKHKNAITIKSVLSHLAASEDAEEDGFTAQQVAMFKEVCDQLQSVTKYRFLRHISNSAAILRHPDLQFDMVRLGIGLYGIESGGHADMALRPVGTLKTTIAQLRKVQSGETIGYNRKGKISRDSVIATIRIGYADGFSRRLSNGVGKVYIKGKMAPVIGTVCMDMTMVDVTDIPNLQEGDEVEIFGSNLSVSQLARWCGTIPYEILTGIHQRVKRVYVEE